MRKFSARRLKKAHQNKIKGLITNQVIMDKNALVIEYRRTNRYKNRTPLDRIRRKVYLFNVYGKRRAVRKRGYARVKEWFKPGLAQVKKRLAKLQDQLHFDRKYNRMMGKVVSIMLILFSINAHAQDTRDTQYYWIPLTVECDTIIPYETVDFVAGKNVTIRDLDSYFEIIETGELQKICNVRGHVKGSLCSEFIMSKYPFVVDEDHISYKITPSGKAGQLCDCLRCGEFIEFDDLMQFDTVVIWQDSTFFHLKE